MKMSNSKLISYIEMSPNHSGTRTMPIDRITPHCFVANCSVERMGKSFANPAREASANYGIGSDGRIGLYVPEDYRSWCSSSNANDQRAVTIECASDNFYPYAMTNAVYKSLVDLCADICARNGKNTLLWLGDKEKSLSYAPKPNEMLITVHRWFANKSCPGDWLFERLNKLCVDVNAVLRPSQIAPEKITYYRVQVGSFRKKAYAERLLKKLKESGFTGYITKVEK